MTAIEPATPASGPTDIPGTPVWLPADNELHTELVDLVLDAVYPATGIEAAAMSQESLDQILESTPNAPDYLTNLAAARNRMAGRIIEALAGRLHELWQADASADAIEQLDIVRAGQHLQRDTLRSWAVWCDQIADRAAGRRADAAWGARHVADQIRRELAHPHDQPDLAAFTYRDEDLFDRKRTDPSTTSSDEQENEQA